MWKRIQTVYGRTDYAFAIFWRRRLWLLYTCICNASMIEIDSLIYGQTQSLSFIGLMTYPGWFRHADRDLYSMNRRSATYLGMTISLGSGPFQKYPGCVNAVSQDGTSYAVVRHALRAVAITYDARSSRLTKYVVDTVVDIRIIPATNTVVLVMGLSRSTLAKTGVVALDTMDCIIS